MATASYPENHTMHIRGERTSQKFIDLTIELIKRQNVNVLEMQDVYIIKTGLINKKEVLIEGMHGAKLSFSFC